MRALWSGTLAFGLINIPVQLYSASRDIPLDLDLLHRKDHQPLKYVRLCAADGEEVLYKDAVRGYEYRKGQYVVLTDEDLKKANVHGDKTLQILHFADLDEIDPLYYEKPYWAGPGKAGGRPYALLREALAASGKVAIARFVLRNRSHLAAIRAHGDALVVNQLRYQDEIRPSEDLDLPDIEASRDETDMALRLVDHLSRPFDPSEHHDTYIEELRRTIRLKAEGRKRSALKREKPKPVRRTADLMTLMRESLEHRETPIPH